MTAAVLLTLGMLLAQPAEASATGPGHVVAVRPAAGPGCPSAADVQTALRGLLRPGALVEFEAATNEPRLVATLEPLGPAASRLRLTDGQAGVRLERTLAIAEGEGTKDCAALADTAALIVERYLVELDYKPPPAPVVVAPPPPEPGRWELSASSAWMPDAPRVSGLELGARAGRQLGSQRRLILALGARTASAWDPVPGNSLYRGRAHQRRWPIDLGLWWRSPRRWFEVQAGGGAALDITRTTSEGDPGRVATRTLPGPALWLGAALQRQLAHRIFARLGGSVHAALVQYDFSHRPSGVAADVTAFTTPPRRFYGKLAIDIGISLP